LSEYPLQCRVSEATETKSDMSPSTAAAIPAGAHPMINPDQRYRELDSSTVITMAPWAFPFAPSEIWGFTCHNLKPFRSGSSRDLYT
jgi:hypothetical protein